MRRRDGWDSICMAPSSPPRLWSPGNKARLAWPGAREADEIQMKYSSALEAELAEGHAMQEAYEKILHCVGQELRQSKATLLNLLRNVALADAWLHEHQPHVESAVGDAHETLDNSSDSVDTPNRSEDAKIYDLARLMEDRGDLQTAAFLCRQVCEHRGETLGEQAPQTVAAMRKLASLLMDTGELEEASALYHSVWRASCSQDGEAHPRTLSASADWAMCLVARGHLEAAAPILGKVMDAQRVLLGREHRDYLTTVGNLSDLQRQLGQLKQAESTLGDAVAVASRALGDTHQTTLVLEAKAARLGFAFGDTASAEATLRDVVLRMQRAIGRRHPQTIKYAGVLDSWRRGGC